MITACAFTSASKSPRGESKTITGTGGEMGIYYRGIWYSKNSQHTRQQLYYGVYNWCEGGGESVVKFITEKYYCNSCIQPDVLRVTKSIIL